ncbi:VanZ family protein, partial [Tritonibacter sp. SIMBA_163]|uniref:VanZ family protein n=1 Tax=Tritonibacter sp. SIMBA_163 TaxID=3080868 RepID=UPI00397F3F93
LFAPVGVFLVWDRPRRRWLSAWCRAVAVVAAASWLLECTQSLPPSRFASLNDVLANTASGAIGGALGVLIRPLAGPAAFWL